MEGVNFRSTHALPDYDGTSRLLSLAPHREGAAARAAHTVCRDGHSGAISAYTGDRLSRTGDRRLRTGQGWGQAQPIADACCLLLESLDSAFVVASDADRDCRGASLWTVRLIGFGPLSRSEYQRPVWKTAVEDSG